ncbi:MAG: 4Fe-4S binding protein [Fibrobacter sp.]|nr:4Fe-4S binding protein [Fibrobacter sp.]
MVTIDNSVCDECGTCISVCPSGSISMVCKPVIESKSCILCGKCVKVCPLGALKLEKISEDKTTCRV